MGTVYINDQEVEVGPKDNVVQAARRAGVEIPHYCWHHELSVVASCRMCLVEVGEKKPDGTVAMLPRLVPACQTPAKPGTVVRTDSPKVKTSQEQTLEFLLLNHPLDCSICDQAGECYLQDYTFKYGRAHSRLDEPKVHREDKYHIGDQIALFTDRCVMCTRCVRFTREVSGTAELHVVNRGSVEEIEVFPDKPCNNKLAGNVVDLCPVGALCSKDFLYKKRVWWLRSADSVCTGCSTGCSITVDQNENQIYRLRPRENPQAQGSFMCDDGRFGWKYVHGEDRLTSPRLGKATQAQALVGASASGQGNGKANSTVGTFAPPADLQFADPWPEVLQAVRAKFEETSKKSAQKGLALFSPFMTVEEAYLLAAYLKDVDKGIVLAMGPIPVVGEDDCYPKDHKGRPPAPEKVRFTIRAEKCPNRRGVEAVLKHFQGEVIDFAQARERIQRGSVEAALIVGGYEQTDVWDSAFLASVQSLATLVVIDFRRSALTDQADILLAGATFAEREGTVVNHAGLAQSLRPAIRSTGDARPDGRVWMELSGRKGLYHPESLRKEIASKIGAFAALGTGELGELGIKVFG